MNARLLSDDTRKAVVAALQSVVSWESACWVIGGCDPAGPCPSCACHDALARLGVAPRPAHVSPLPTPTR